MNHFLPNIQAHTDSNPLLMEGKKQATDSVLRTNRRRLDFHSLGRGESCGGGGGVVTC